MTTNPLIDRAIELEIEQEDVTSDLRRWQDELAWFRAFDIDQANTGLRAAQRSEAEAQVRLPQLLQAEARQKDLVRQLDQKVSLGIDPRYWFSSERAVAKRALAQEERKLAEHQASLIRLRTELEKTKERRLAAEGRMDRARKFEPLTAEGAIATLQATLECIEPRLTDMCRRRDALDNVIREPLAQLRRYDSLRAEIQARILNAEDFEADLSMASSSRDRALIHQQCERELGDGKPHNVLRESRGALRGVDDSINKLRTRIEGLIRFATHDIRRVVIDGNNMCYRGSQFIGLVALEAVVPLLAKKHDVALVFDASIRRQLGMRNQDIEARFPDACLVHVVASKQKSDMTVLSVAEEDDHTFVISNDNYKDFPEKMAVKEHRVLRHEIVDQVAYVHDLQIAGRF